VLKELRFREKKKKKALKLIVVERGHQRKTGGK